MSTIDRSNDRLVYFADLKARWNISYCRMHIRRLINDYTPPRFPQNLVLGNGRIAWWESDILAYLSNATAPKRRTKTY